ncbi:hypothetical protein THAOC_31432 [Thalassiosira oceanica]|uniref:Uncharacterized protein n=1 Tax=Thalassiosira oceanica TaxID=159749 RepID=K0R874_THAOC|nr:hypothetical protein THAOC_31432 [Thalassiosira oceanica]|eukprot:EJK49668.1 hypothetical protein THAOC_31432 [Thalassiosira oceanica]
MAKLECSLRTESCLRNGPKNHRKTVVDDVQGVDGAPLPRRGVNSSRQRGRAVCSSHRSRRRRGTNPRPRLRRGGDTSEVEPPHPPNLNGPGDPGVAPESPNKKPPNGSGDSTTRLSSVSLNLCLDQASLAELEAVAGAEAVDGLSVPNEKTGLPEATPPILGAVPSAFSSPAYGRASETAQPTNKR